MSRARLGIVLSAALIATLAGWRSGGTTQPPAGFLPSIDSTILKTLKWRNVGPDRAGRSIAISGVVGQPKVGYFGATGGGLWKPTDGGEHWVNITDGQIHSSSVGAVAVSETEPNTVFMGMGEAEIRGDIQPGDGVYKSTDAGKTWSHVGFSNSDAIAHIRIHPTNPNIVFVADFGKFGANSEERGIFKSTDGGKSWRKVLYKSPNAGGVDVEIDRKNPNVMYAALWEAYRKEWQMSSGGPGSGMYKSTDGGESWTEITHATGLPAGIDEIGVYYKNKSGAWVALMPEVVNFKPGGVMISIASAGIVKGDVNGHIVGPKAKMVLTFPVVLAVYAPEGVAITEYQLLRLHPNSDSREFRSVTGGVMHVSGGATRDLIDFQSDKLAPRVYQITMQSTLGKGEFGLLPPGAYGSSNMGSSGKIYSMSVPE